MRLGIVGSGVWGEMLKRTEMKKKDLSDKR